MRFENVVIVARDVAISTNRPIAAVNLSATALGDDGIGLHLKGEASSGSSLTGGEIKAPFGVIIDCRDSDVLRPGGLAQIKARIEHQWPELSTVPASEVAAAYEVVTSTLPEEAVQAFAETVLGKAAEALGTEVVQSIILLLQGYS